MTNRKIKSNLIQSNLRAREFWDCSERNVCTVWLALLDAGVSENKINQIDDEFHAVTVPQCRQDAADGVLDARFKAWLASVGITRGDIENATKRHRERLMRAFVSREAFSVALDVLQADLIALLYQVSVSLGYGHKRLKRVIDYMIDYNGDAKADVARLLHIRYPDPDELPDVTDLYQRKRKLVKEQEQAKIIAREMLAV